VGKARQLSLSARHRLAPYGFLSGSDFCR